MLSFFPQDVLDESLNLIGSVSEDFLPTLSKPVYLKLNEIIYNQNWSIVVVYYVRHCSELVGWLVGWLVLGLTAL